MELTWYGLSIKEVITHSVHLHAMNVKNGWHYQTGAVLEATRYKITSESIDQKPS